MDGVSFLASSIMKITDWSLDDRPREKMMANGEETLSDAELLAILINTGQQGRTAVDIARDVLKQCGGSLERLHNVLIPNDDPNSQKLLKGIGPAKGCTIRAALELGRRLEQEMINNKTRSIRITGSDVIFEQFNQQLSHLDHEELWALYTSRSGKMLQKVLIGQGGVDSAAGDVRLIVRPALQYLASGVALCHNHPHSGMRPSNADRQLTETAQKALALFGIQLLDHVIIADGQYYSFRDYGEL